MNTYSQCSENENSHRKNKSNKLFLYEQVPQTTHELLYKKKSTESSVGNGGYFAFNKNISASLLIVHFWNTNSSSLCDKCSSPTTHYGTIARARHVFHKSFLFMQRWIFEFAIHKSHICEFYINYIRKHLKKGLSLQEIITYNKK